MTVYGVNFNALTSMLNVATINLNFLTSEVITFNHTAALTYLLHSNISWCNILKNKCSIWIVPVFCLFVFVFMQELKKKKEYGPATVSSVTFSRSFEVSGM